MLLGDNAGRRRITQLSKDEWRAALEQQIAEKQQSKQRQRAASPDSGGHLNDDGNQEWPADNGSAAPTPPSEMQPEDAWGHSSERAGRRGVQQMSNEEWRQALEQQIQAKKQQKEQSDLERGAGSRRRVSASAPTTETNSEQSSVFASDANAAARVPPSSASTLPAGVGGRRRVTQLSQEEYLKSVQEQIEQKRLAKEREKALNAESPVKPIVKHEPEAETATAVAGAKATLMAPPPPPAAAAAESIAVPSNLNDHKADSDIPKPVEAGSDPIAIATIVSFYEELKKQNEDVKQQLVEQHSVLTSLQSRLVVSTVTSPATASSLAKPTEERSRVKSLEVRVAGARPIRAAALRPRVSRGDSKIPLPPSLQTAASQTQETIPLVEKSSAGKALIETVKAVESYATVKLQQQQDTEVVSKQEDEEKAPLHDTNPTPQETMIHNQDEPNIPEPEAADPTALAPSHEPSNQEDEEIGSSEHERRNITDAGDPPMMGDSELVSETERISVDGELLSCTSTCVFDGPSSLVALDTSMAEIFQR